MRAIFKRNWQVKVLFVGIWILVGYFGNPTNADLTRDPSPPWLFYSTLRALLLSFAWANQAGAEKRGLAGIEKYARWTGDVVADILVFALTLLIPLLVYAYLYANVSYATRRSHNAELILSGNSLRNEITIAADQAGKLVGAAAGLAIPPLRDGTDFFHVSADGLMVLHSKKTESTLLFIPRMEGGKTLWRCLGFPASAFSPVCRGETRSWTSVMPGHEPAPADGK